MPGVAGQWDSGSGLNVLSVGLLSFMTGQIFSNIDIESTFMNIDIKCSYLPQIFF